MVRAPENVQALELYQLFVFDPTKSPECTNCVGINNWLTRLAEHNAKASGINLRELFKEATIPR
jgi:hypothetical protein